MEDWMTGWNEGLDGRPNILSEWQAEQVVWTDGPNDSLYIENTKMFRNNYSKWFLRPDDPCMWYQDIKNIIKST